MKSTVIANSRKIVDKWGKLHFRKFDFTLRTKFKTETFSYKCSYTFLITAFCSPIFYKFGCPRLALLELNTVADKLINATTQLCQHAAEQPILDR